MRTLRSGRNRNLRVEKLEQRIALAGDVSVAITVGGDLTIAGDAADNSITITPSPTAGEYIITGNIRDGAPTTINGLASVDTATLINTPTGDILINMSNGDDQVIVLGINSPSNLQVDGDGDGVAGPTQDNEVEIGVDPLNANAIHPVTINGSLIIANMSTVDIQNSFINSNAVSTITGTTPANINSAVNNSFTIKRSTFLHDLSIGSGDLESTFDVDQIQARNTTIFGGDGDDIVTQIARSQFNQLTLNLGLGNDTVTTVNSNTISGGNLSIDLGDGQDSLFVNGVAVTAGNFLLNAGAGVANQVDSITIGNLSTVVVNGNFIVTLGNDNKLFTQNNTVVTGSETITGGTGTSSVTVAGSNITGNLIIDYATNAGSTGGLIDVHGTNVGGAATLRSGANGDTIRILNGTVNGVLTAAGGAGADSITLGDAVVNATTALSAGSISVTAGTGIDAVRIGFATSPVISLNDLTVALGAEADTFAQIFMTVLGDATITNTGTNSIVGLTNSGVVGDLNVQIGEGAFSASQLNVANTMTVDAGSTNMINSLSVNTAIFLGGTASITGITISNSTFGSNMYMRGRAAGVNHLTLLNSVVAQSLVINKDGSGVTTPTQQNVIYLNTNSTFTTYIDGGAAVDNVSVLASVSQGLFASLGTDDDSMSVSNFICPNGEFDGGAGTNTLIFNNTNFSRLIRANFS